VFALDETGVEVSDTWHEDVDDALAQAEAEFGVTPDAWRDLTSSD
jgi:hypothetical protein